MRLSQKALGAAAPCGVFSSFWWFLQSQSYSRSSGKRRHGNFAKFFLARPHYSPIILPDVHARGWQRTVKQTRHLQRWEGEHRWVWLLPRCVTPAQGFVTRVHGLQNTFVCHIQPVNSGLFLAAQWWEPLNWGEQSSTPQISVQGNSSGKAILQENASGAHKDLMGIWRVVLIPCHRSLGNIKNSIITFKGLDFQSD